MNRIPRTRKIGVGCILLGSLGLIGGNILKDILPYSAIIGWFWNVILILCAVYFFSNESKEYVDRD